MASGAKRAYRRLRLHAARHDGYSQLWESGAPQEELADLYTKLGGDTEPDEGLRIALDKWLHTARRQRRAAWTEWRRQQQHRKSGGHIYKRAQRSKAGEGYTSMRAETGETQHTTDTRLEVVGRRARIQKSQGRRLHRSCAKQWGRWRTLGWES